MKVNKINDLSRRQMYRNYATNTKVYFILDRLEIKVAFVIKSSLSLHEVNPVYPTIHVFQIVKTIV